MPGGAAKARYDLHLTACGTGEARARVGSHHAELLQAFDRCGHNGARSGGKIRPPVLAAARPAVWCVAAPEQGCILVAPRPREPSPPVVTPSPCVLLAGRNKNRTWQRAKKQKS